MAQSLARVKDELKRLKKGPPAQQLCLRCVTSQTGAHEKLGIRAVELDAECDARIAVLGMWHAYVYNHCIIVT